MCVYYDTILYDTTIYVVATRVFHKPLCAVVHRRPHDLHSSIEIIAFVTVRPVYIVKQLLCTAAGTVQIDLFTRITVFMHYIAAINTNAVRRSAAHD